MYVSNNLSGLVHRYHYKCWAFSPISPSLPYPCGICSCVNKKEKKLYSREWSDNRWKAMYFSLIHAFRLLSVYVYTDGQKEQRMRLPYVSCQPNLHVILSPCWPRYAARYSSPWFVSRVQPFDLSCVPKKTRNKTTQLIAFYILADNCEWHSSDRYA